MLDPTLSQKLTALGQALINQEAAKVLVEPQDRSTGFWFGGGNIVQDRDGSYLAIGRFRNFGDSRTGVGAGARGLEMAIYRSPEPLGPYEKIKSFSKADLKTNGKAVVSIEGTALHWDGDTLEVFVSTEKDIPYPAGFESFQKPGTGVWSIDRLHAGSVEDLSADSLEEIVIHDEPAVLHAKDPVVTDLPDGSLALIYCNHPFSWSSSNTSVTVRKPGSSTYEHLTDFMLARGPVWDIAATRLTDRLAIPKVGAFADLPDMSLYFYDGCECLRQMDENPRAVKRPRGYSCEELSGIAGGIDTEFPSIERISLHAPLFISPHGTGCSRYVDTLVTDGGILASWQQSQEDLSQPLVGHFLPMEEVEKILS